MDFTPHTEADVARMLGARRAPSTRPTSSPTSPTEVRAAPDLGTSRAAVGTRGDGATSIGSGSRNASGLVCFAGGGIYDHHLPPVVRPHHAARVRHLLHPLSERGGPGGAPGAVRVPVDGRGHHRPSGGQRLALRRPVVRPRGRQPRRGRDRTRSAVWVSRGVAPAHPGDHRTPSATPGTSRSSSTRCSTDARCWAADAAPAPAAVLFAQPNYLGVIEDYDAAGGLAHATRSPGRRRRSTRCCWGCSAHPGAAGCDIAFAEGQPLGNPMSFGGPVLGVFATTRQPDAPHSRRASSDAPWIDDGRVAYTLTLRTREQDIRREKASSNICTNQTLNAIAAAVHLAWLGPRGPRRGRPAVDPQGPLPRRPARPGSPG